MEEGDLLNEEWADTYDEEFRPLGKAPRRVVLEKGLWVSSFQCWIVRMGPPATLLFQKRSSRKRIYPNLLDISAAGHYQAGEEVAEGVREIAEELGVEVPFSSLIPLGIRREAFDMGKNRVREFCRLYLWLNERALEQYSLCRHELAGLYEIPLDEGIAFFNKKSGSLFAKGVQLSGEKGRRSEVAQLTLKDFVPRDDPYYVEIFEIAKKAVMGVKPQRLFTP